MREASVASASSRSASSAARVGVAEGEVLVGHPVEHGREPGGHLGARDCTSGQVLAHVLHRDRDLVLAVERDVAR